MYFIDAIRVLLRQWKILLVGVIVLVAAGVAVVRYVPTQYQASGQLFLLLPSEATGKNTPTNPYLNLQDGLTTTGSLIASFVSTKDAQRSISAAGFTSEYAVALNPGTGPLLIITAKDTNPAEALRTRDEVMRRLNDQLSLIQNQVSVPKSQFIRSQPTSVEQNAEVLPGSKSRALAGAGAVDVLITLIIAFTWDARQRRRRRAAAREADRASGADRTSRPGGKPGRERPPRRPSSAPPADSSERSPAGAKLVTAATDEDLHRGGTRRTGT